MSSRSSSCNKGKMMKLEDATNFLKAFSSNPTVIWGTLFTVIPSVFFGGYTAITRYNEMVSVIDENKEIVKRAASQSKELAELRVRLDQEQAARTSELSAKTIELNAIKDRQVQLSEAMIRVSEKASDAIALARETKAIAEGSQKESRAALAGIRSELETTNQSLRTEMQVLRRATVNPLGK